MYKLVNGLILGVISFIGIAFVTMQYIAILIYGLNYTLDYNVLFYQGNNKILYCLLFISSLVPFSIICLGPSSNDNKYDKKNYTGLASQFDVKRFTHKVSIKKINGEYGIFLTIIDYLHIMITPVLKVINKVAFFVIKKNIVKEAKKHKIGDERPYKRSGLPFITKNKKMWVDMNDHHNLIIGTTGSGKSVLIIIVKLLLEALSGESVVVVDVKGELSQYTAPFYKKRGYDVIFIDFLDPTNSDGWNPLHIPAKYMCDELAKAKVEFAKYAHQHEETNKAYKSLFGEEFEFENTTLKNEHGDNVFENGQINTSIDLTKSDEYFTQVANTIAQVGKGDGDSFWNDSAAKTIKGFFYLLAETGDLENCNLPNLMNLVVRGEEKDGMKNTVLQTFLNTLPDTSIAKQSLYLYANSAENTRKSINSVIEQHLGKMIVSQRVNRVISTNTIDLQSIGKKKTIVYLKVHDEKQTYYPLVTLFLSQLWQELATVSRDNNMRLPVPVNIDFDEFGQFPALDEIINILTAGRSRGVRLTIAVQGYDQLEEIYGKNRAETIENNCMNTVYLMSGSKETQKKIAERTGMKKIKEGNRFVDAPLLTEKRLAEFSFGEVLIFQQRKKPYHTFIKPYFNMKWTKNLEEYKLEEKYYKKPKIIGYQELKDLLKNN